MNRRTGVLVEALLPPHAELPVGRESGLSAFLDAFHAEANPKLRLGFRLGVLVATWVAPLLVRRIPPLGRLEPEARQRALTKMAGSRSYPLRQLLGLVKTVVSLGYGADQAVRRAIGYGGAVTR